MGTGDTSAVDSGRSKLGTHSGERRCYRGFESGAAAALCGRACRWTTTSSSILYVVRSTATPSGRLTPELLLPADGNFTLCTRDLSDLCHTCFAWSGATYTYCVANSVTAPVRLPPIRIPQRTICRLRLHGRISS